MNNKQFKENLFEKFGDIPIQIIEDALPKIRLYYILSEKRKINFYFVTWISALVNSKYFDDDDTIIKIIAEGSVGPRKGEFICSICKEEQCNIKKIDKAIRDYLMSVTHE